jgi:hypothetical protein
MKVYGKCGNCKHEIKYSTSANTRVEFAMKEEENKTLTCANCGLGTKFHVDELYAKESKIAQIFAGLIFIIGTPLILFFVSSVFFVNSNHYVAYAVGGFLLIPIMVYRIIKQQDRTRVNSFNRYELKR